ncbi:hypothetical protein ACH4SP_19080 [Streptomyces sp. NPDC021093]|uniref:hypothetical protein n=1 Tax=Streptomyces sp. NPDC021093 TaxID=3365112 RepID=UPI0037A840A7
MTACAIETAPEDGAVRRCGFTIAADGSYAARLAGAGEAWFPERWTLDGPEPYSVPLPAGQPEEPGTELLPLADGRVLIHRVVAPRHVFSLLYPTGPATGELPLGAVEFEAGPVTLLPPTPGGSAAYALAVGPHSTSVWLVAGGAFGPEHVAEVRGRCTGGVWLDRTGRMLALDREAEGGGAVKSVAVDLERGGEATPLLQIAERSNDRLLLADPDSGLIVIRSDAPGEDRLGWGVLGSARPVRFPEALRVGDCTVTPFAAQPGQVLMPESCAVAVRIDGPGGTSPASTPSPTPSPALAPSPASWFGMWRPSGRRLHQLAAPAGWLPGAGLWTREGVLRLPFATGAVPCGVAEVCAPMLEEDGAAGEPSGPSEPEQAPEGGAATAWKPVPLQQAPLMGRLHRVGTRPGARSAPETRASSVTVAPPPVAPSVPPVPPSPAPTVMPPAAPESAHAAAPAMVRTGVPVMVKVPAPTLLTGPVSPLNGPGPG